MVLFFKFGSPHNKILNFTQMDRWCPHSSVTFRKIKHAKPFLGPRTAKSKPKLY